MNKENKHITLKELLVLLENENSREETICFLKNLDPKNEDVKGLKLFLETNNYDIKRLNDFATNSKPSFNTLLQEKKKVATNRNWLKYAAVFIPLIGIGYFMMNRTSHNLYSKYYEKEVGLPVTMGNDNKIVFNEAMNAFKDNEYEEALLGFNELLENKPTNDTLLYFVGCVYLELDSLDKAILNFDEVNDPLLLKEKSEFRLALVYLKKEDFKLAKITLQYIAENKNHIYNTAALNILKEPVFK